jgi:hypothetical protein
MEQREQPRVSEDASDLETRLLARIRSLYGNDAPEAIRWKKGRLTQSSTLVMKDEDAPSRMQAPATQAEAGISQYAASRGDVATGIIVDTIGNQLYLDVNPCHVEMLSFRQPYSKKAVGKKRCGEKEHELMMVEQR